MAQDIRIQWRQSSSFPNNPIEITICKNKNIDQNSNNVREEKYKNTFQEKKSDADLANLFLLSI